MEETEKNNNQNFHASVVDVAGFGILILGESGAGKSSLALGIIEKYSDPNTNACLIADDQVFLDKNSVGKIVARTPPSIAGKLEIYGFGIVDVAYKNDTLVGLVVELIDQDQVVRMPKPAVIEILGVDVPHLHVPSRYEAQGLRIISAWLKQHSVI